MPSNNPEEFAILVERARSVLRKLMAILNPWRSYAGLGDVVAGIDVFREQDGEQKLIQSYRRDDSPKGTT